MKFNGDQMPTNVQPPVTVVSICVYSCSCTLRLSLLPHPPSLLLCKSWLQSNSRKSGTVNSIKVFTELSSKQYCVLPHIVCAYPYHSVLSSNMYSWSQKSREYTEYENDRVMAKSKRNRNSKRRETLADSSKTLYLRSCVYLVLCDLMLCLIIVHIEHKNRQAHAYTHTHKHNEMSNTFLKTIIQEKQNIVKCTITRGRDSASFCPK